MLTANSYIVHLSTGRLSTYAQSATRSLRPRHEFIPGITADDPSRPATIWKMWKGGAGLQPAFGLHRERTGETACPTFSNPRVSVGCGCAALHFPKTK